MYSGWEGSSAGWGSPTAILRSRAWMVVCTTTPPPPAALLVEAKVTCDPELAAGVAAEEECEPIRPAEAEWAMCCGEAAREAAGVRRDFAPDITSLSALSSASAPPPGTLAAAVALCILSRSRACASFASCFASAGFVCCAVTFGCSCAGCDAGREARETVPLDPRMPMPGVARPVPTRDLRSKFGWEAEVARGRTA